MSDFALTDDYVDCDRCGEVFTDESSYISHVESDHGDKEEDFEEVADRVELIMDPNLTESNMKKARKILLETNQQELHHSVPFKNPKARIPKTQEPHTSADDLVAGVSGYNDNPNNRFYSNKIFRKGSSTERPSSLGEARAREGNFWDIDSSYGVKTKDELLDKRIFLQHFIDSARDEGFTDGRIEAYQLKLDDVQREIASLGQAQLGQRDNDSDLFPYFDVDGTEDKTWDLWGKHNESKASEYEDGAYCKKCLASGNHRDKCDCDKAEEFNMGTNNPDGTPNTAYPRLHNKDALDYSEDEKDEDKIHQGFDYQQGLESKASEGDMEDNEDQVAMADGQADLEDDWDSIDDAFKTDAQIAEDKQRSGEGGVGSGRTANLPEQAAMSNINPDYNAFSKDEGNVYDSPMIDSEANTSNYEVDVDEYLKTGDPVQKTGRGRSDLDNQERITGEKHVKDWHGNTADVDDDNNITNRKSYREAYDYDGNEISGLQEQAIKWWNWQDAKHDSFIPPQGEYPEGTSFEQEEEIHKGMLNVIGSATSPMSGEGLEADELDRLVSYLVGKGLITDNSFIASEADDSIVRTTREGPNMFEDIENPDFAWKGDDGETTSKEADNYQQKPHMTDNEWEKDLSDIKNRYQTETKDVSYDEDYEINIQGKDKELEDIPALEGINYGYESYESYPTKKSRVGKTKASEVYDGIVDDYEKFQVSDDENVTEMITARKLQGYRSEGIAKELTLVYGVSREEALEKVYSIEVSSNDRVANTFFQKMYKNCNEAEIKEMRMYCGSDL